MGLSREEAFKVLELPYGADPNSIRGAYKKLALKWHPDKHSNSDEATKKFQSISTAYKKLTSDMCDAEDVEIRMSMADMFNLFHHIFAARMAHEYWNGYETSDSDYDFEDDNVNNYYEHFGTARRGPTGKLLTPEEIERNANELITEEEKEEKKAEKRRAKKKRQREKKRLEKEQQKKDEQKKASGKQNGELKSETTKANKSKDSSASEGERQREKKRLDKEHQKKDEEKKVSGKQNGELKSETPRTDKSKESSASEGEDFDEKAAFFTKALNKTKKASSTETNSTTNVKTKEKTTSVTSKDESGVHDPTVLRSRQLAIRGNQMANCGHYQAAIDLFTEAIKLDPKDFRFFGNRSYCFDRLELYDRALRDAEKAIDLEPDWPKGYFRKGRALAGLKLYSDAEVAFTQVLKLDKSCKVAIEEQSRVRTLQLTEMGFSQQQAQAAIKQHGSVQKALDSLLLGHGAENALGGEIYLSDDEEIDSHHPVTHRAPSITSQHEYFVSQRGADTKMDPANPEGLTALWVGNVLREVTEERLKAMFSKYGVVTSVRCLPDKFCAFVNFRNKEGAGKAMGALQGVECAGQRLLIKFPDNPITSNGNVVIRKNGTTGKSYEHKRPGTDEITLAPVNGDECYFWRTTGCIYKDNCKFKHLPQSKGIDRKPWQR